MGIVLEILLKVDAISVRYPCVVLVHIFQSASFQAYILFSSQTELLSVLGISQLSVHNKPQKSW